MIISIMIPKSDENPMDPSLTNGESRSIVSVPDGAGQTDGSVHTEVHLLLQLQQGDVVLHEQYVAFYIRPKDVFRRRRLVVRRRMSYGVVCRTASSSSLVVRRLLNPS